MTTTDDDLAGVIDRYLRASARGGAGSGTYRASAETPLRSDDHGFEAWAATRGVSLGELEDRERGPRVMRRWAQRLRDRVDADELSVATARTYWNVTRACLEHAVRDGALAWNPAQTDRASEPLPEDTDPDDQQFWTAEARDRLLRYCDQRAHDALDEHGSEAVAPVRDRALAYVLAYGGVRGAEVLRAREDDRPGRQGLRWGQVDTEAWTTLRVLGKSQEWEDVGLTSDVRDRLQRLYRILDAPPDDWPVFPSLHAPTLYRAAPDALDDALADVTGGAAVLQAWRAAIDGAIDSDASEPDGDAAPPALTTGGGRDLLERLCGPEHADVDVDGEYLKPHGARRQLGDDLYDESPTLAQDALRHRSIQTTKQQYSDREAAQRAAEIERVLEGTTDADADAEPGTEGDPG